MRDARLRLRIERGMGFKVIAVKGVEVFNAKQFAQPAARAV